MAAAVEVLERAGAPARLAGPLVRALGDDAAALLRGDPWRLLSLPEITPEQADFTARRLLGASAVPTDERRARALVVHLLTRAARTGHTALPAAEVVRALAGLGVRDGAGAVDSALDDGLVIAVDSYPADDDADPAEPAEMPDPVPLLALGRYGLAEETLGEGLGRLAGTAEALVDSATAAEAAEAAAERLGRSPAPETLAALVAVALRGVVAVPAGPGAGDAVADLVALLPAIAEAAEVGAVVTAPSGTSAEALAAAAGVPATPLRALLGGRPDGGYAHGEAAPLEAGLVVVTGAETLDVELGAALVEACADGTHLVLVGDPDAPPPPGPGAVLADVLDARVVPVAALPAPRPRPGSVTALAASLAAGELPPVPAPGAGGGRELVVVRASSAAEAVHRTVQLVTDSIPRALGVPAQRVQVVSLLRDGEAGAAALNAACKAALNPGPGAHGGFDPGDRLVAAADGEGFTAGDVGYLAEAGPEGAVVRLFGGEEVPGPDAGPGRELAVPDLTAFRPGWALTAAAAQGGRWRAVVLVVPPFPPGFRPGGPALYGAVTRAAEHLSIVHAAGPALAEAVRSRPPRRRTRLVELLREG
ncbi:helix-hairpin-helix domain-containing protein [Allonocardiopsis opalescens]|uniref:Exodeoxyribonuclease V alpha subunit n=1 Tax=Allonocardiopsis opalescens TaxID=1144618 RepID=A0A2T0Q488_9ACTN|nr:helix-hairpin-helix domain-containing protein [Allonocardiopsis opalescens]PRX98625.1 exodeoxyribonuclease V alpha subunit [Allonocardiopsis opalescens]